ncbi:hypothetical protein [Sphingomonas sp. S2-65]|uniref:hypothetical protein n=1 Tax=Sphingomonas sp. S2-65 TaxID=2903960 RepID=UPI001F343758|nr:hypothetical protein [Sphingomonas sp. S2-65]UYY58522.1 hypothetical protein LZ586_18045 [Sphingomonas sp. S2-65]
MDLGLIVKEHLPARQCKRKLLHHGETVECDMLERKVANDQAILSASFIKRGFRRFDQAKLVRLRFGSCGQAEPKLKRMGAGGELGGVGETVPQFTDILDRELRAFAVERYLCQCTSRRRHLHVGACRCDGRDKVTDALLGTLAAQVAT